MASPPPFSPASACPLWAFPPFFTPQPVDATRARQLEAWRALLVAWAASPEGRAAGGLLPLAGWPHWGNAAVDRRLPPEGAAAVAEHAVARGSAEWADAGRAALRVFARTPAEWAALLADGAARGALPVGAVLTLYELHSGPAAAGAPWEGADAVTLLRALELLEREGKAALRRAASVDETAVRFS